MKRLRVVSVAFAALLATLFVTLAAASPAKADDFKYTVRVFQGNRGEFAEDPVVVHVSPGERLNLYDVATAKITDDRYVQTGFRVSGADTLNGTGEIPGVGEDMDFVVAYGVKSNTVPYTLKFVEYSTGKELAQSKTYYGKVGEKPVAAYEHIEGYRPRYLAITGTLQEGEDNVWTFEYIPLAEGETIVTTTTTTNTTYTTTPAGGTTTETVTTEGGGGTEGGTTTTTTTTGGGANQGAAGTEGNQGTQGTEGTEGAQAPAGGEEEAPQTQEILDLDTPLAGPDSAQNGKKIAGEASLLFHPPVIAAGAVILAAAAGLIIFFVTRKKEATDEEE